MKLYMAGNCYVNALEVFILGKGCHRLCSYAYQVEEGKPVKDLKVAVDMMDGKKIDTNSYRFKRKPR